MAVKSKARVVIARLMSTAGTGYMYTTRRLRVMERLSMMKYDPIVKRHVLFKEVKGKK
ncbi:large subunit ribosomal protein L33 [Malassezia restricta]|uniref:large subunit ribosomal protein L33 n=1 Tax=Malassezia restricta TaxID=76775 RepID=UPI000DD17416|nr:large subunit ribosomal protein L33 [Malassezia restricta]AXA49760.1 large subunit ribosomal protein L33 [Malassezia restricta]